jgi:thiamine-monophosphate kinase
MEESIISVVRKAALSHPLVDIGPGDDAGVFHLPPNQQGLVTCDMLMDKVHFDSSTTSYQLIGRKALAVNLSDIAAMGGKPFAAYISIALPQKNTRAIAGEIHEGIAMLATEFGTVIAGGDTNVWNGPLVLNITVIGTARLAGSILRSGAKVGDRVLVTGSLGGSLQGHHLTFIPRVREAEVLTERYQLNSMTDISDGLASDLRDICLESKVGIELHRAQIPCSPFAALDDPIRSAMCDGEDFELCFTASVEEADRMVADAPLGKTKITIIGNVISDAGLYWVENGMRIPCLLDGYKHGGTNPGK